MKSTLLQVIETKATNNGSSSRTRGARHRTLNLPIFGIAQPTFAVRPSAAGLMNSIAEFETASLP